MTNKLMPHQKNECEQLIKLMETSQDRMGNEPDKQDEILEHLGHTLLSYRHSIISALLIACEATEGWQALPPVRYSELPVRQRNAGMLDKALGEIAAAEEAALPAPQPDGATSTDDYVSSISASDMALMGTHPTLFERRDKPHHKPWKQPSAEAPSSAAGKLSGLSIRILKMLAEDGVVVVPPRNDSAHYHIRNKRGEFLDVVHHKNMSVLIKKGCLNSDYKLTDAGRAALSRR